MRASKNLQMKISFIFLETSRLVFYVSLRRKCANDPIFNLARSVISRHRHNMTRLQGTVNGILKVFFTFPETNPVTFRSSGASKRARSSMCAPRPAQRRSLLPRSSTTLSPRTRTRPALVLCSTFASR